MNPNSTPPDGLCGRESDERGEKVHGDLRAANGPQAGSEGVQPRDIIRDTIHTTLNHAGYWLPAEARTAIADAVTSLRNDDTEKWRRLAVARGLELGRLQRTLELAEATVRTWTGDPNGYDCAQDVLDALTAYQPKEQP